MGVREILGKMFVGAKQSHDEWGQPIQEETMEEKLLRKHMERERKKQVRKTLQYYDRKHYREMTSIKLPYHKKAMRRKKKRKRR